MPSLLYLVFTLGILTITEQRNKPITEIEDLLNYLTAKKSHSSQEADDAIPFFSNQKKWERHMQEKSDNPNLMNIQTLNLYYKHNNLGNKRKDDLENALRLESDRMCKATGRCGCGHGRCGKPKIEDKDVNDIDQLLKDLDRELNGKQTYNTDNDDEDLTLKKRDDKYKRNDDLDIVLLEVSGSEDNNILDKLQRLDDNVKIIDLRDTELSKVMHNSISSSNNDKRSDVTFDAVNPEDLFMYYELGKVDIKNALVDYVKGGRNRAYLDNLTPFQKKQIDVLKSLQSQKPIEDDEIKSQITDLLFGTYSSIKVLPQLQDGNIYVPQRVYDAIIKYNKNGKLRLQKSLFPLTAQQKERQQKRQKKDKINTIPTQSLRRNMQENRIYGIPFNLEIQGLGQIN